MRKDAVYPGCCARGERHPDTGNIRNNMANAFTPRAAMQRRRWSRQKGTDNPCKTLKERQSDTKDTCYNRDVSHMKLDELPCARHVSAKAPATRHFLPRTAKTLDAAR